MGVVSNSREKEKKFDSLKNVRSTFNFFCELSQRHTTNEPTEDLTAANNVPITVMPLQSVYTFLSFLRSIRQR